MWQEVWHISWLQKTLDFHYMKFTENKGLSHFFFFLCPDFQTRNLGCIDVVHYDVMLYIIWKVVMM